MKSRSQKVIHPAWSRSLTGGRKGSGFGEDGREEGLEQGRDLDLDSQNKGFIFKNPESQI